MNFTKIISTLFFTLLTVNSYGNGCQSLKSSNWSGQLLLSSGTHIALRMQIKNVVPVSEELFALTGTMNDEKLTARVGCVEQRPGNIRSILIDTESMHLTTHLFIPNHQKPVMLRSLSGKFKDYAIDEISNDSNNYLFRAS
jgi:hypothetical protein